MRRQSISLYIISSLVVLLKVSSASCIVPNATDDFYLNNDAAFCTASYSFNDTNQNGVIIFNSSNIILDCNSSTINIFNNPEPVDYGIVANTKNNITIKNCKIPSGGVLCIHLRGVTSSSIMNNYLNGNTLTCGITLALSSTGNHIINNTITRSGGSNVEILSNSGRNFFINNNFSYAIGVIGGGVFPDEGTIGGDDFIGNIFEGNGRGLYFEAKGNYTVINNTFVKNVEAGIRITQGGSNPGSRNNFIYNNTFIGDARGIYITSGTNNTIYSNRFYNSTVAHIDAVTNNNSLNFSKRGNYYDDISKKNLNITDSNSDGLYDSGTQFPYNSTNGGNITGALSDWLPCVYENCLFLDGGECSSASDCVGGYCVHNICRSTATHCPDSFCDSPETCSTCPQDCGQCPTTTKPLLDAGGPVITTTTKTIPVTTTLLPTTTTIVNKAEADEAQKAVEMLEKEVSGRLSEKAKKLLEEAKLRLETGNYSLALQLAQRGLQEIQKGQEVLKEEKPESRPKTPLLITAIIVLIIASALIKGNWREIKWRLLKRGWGTYFRPSFNAVFARIYTTL